MNRRLLLFFVLLITLFAIGAFWVHTATRDALEQRIELDDEALLVLKEGQSANRLITQLSETYSLRFRFWLKVALKLHPSLTAIKQGTYAITPGDTVESVLLNVVQGREKHFLITLVEGKTFKQWLTQLNQTRYLEPTSLSALQWPEALVAPRGGRLEGWLLPDTYSFTANEPAEAVIARAYAAMQQYLTQAWERRAIDLPLESPYEALIMASIVEKETGLAVERPLIAGVFMNRIRQKMRLQTDPTVIYGLGDAFDGNITRQHLRQSTPYNTYVIKGLPPTPIAMPSRAAIDAVMHPEQTNALYFVSKGDGSHVFSETLAEHNAAVRQYQLKQ